MNQQDWKNIIFCQGGKNELEELTGEEYEHISPEEIKAIFPEGKPTDYSRNTFPTFIEVLRQSGNGNPRTMRKELYKKASQLNADAIIHYTEGHIKIIARNNYIRGTPVRRKG